MIGAHSGGSEDASGTTPGGRLDRGDAAAVGGVAQRAAEVVAQPERRHAAGQGTGLAAARAAGRHARVPRVAGEAVQGRVGVHAEPEVGQVGAGEGDGAGGAHALDDGRVEGGDGVGRRRARPGGGPPGDVDVLLHRDRHAVQWSSESRRRRRRPGRRRRRRLSASSPRPATTALSHRVDGIDAVEQGVQHLPARRLPLADHRRPSPGPPVATARSSPHHGRPMEPPGWIGARPRTLPAAVVPVAVGAGCAVGAGSVDVVARGAWRSSSAWRSRSGVNYANDYSDGVRGTDDVRVGPVRLVASGLAPPGAVKRAAFAAFGVAAVAGLALAASTCWWLLAVGAAAIAAAWFYTGGPAPVRLRRARRGVRVRVLRVGGDRGHDVRGHRARSPARHA